MARTVKGGRPADSTGTKHLPDLTTAGALPRHAAVPVDLYRAFVFPNRIREERRARGFQRLLALSASIPEIPYIRLSKIERGEVFARADELVQIAAALACEPESLLIDVDSPDFEIADWAEPFLERQSLDVEAERLAVLLGAALRERRSRDRGLTMVVLDKEFGLPPVIVSRIENAHRPLDRWNAATVSSLCRLFGVEDRAALAAYLFEQHGAGALGPFLASVGSPELRLSRTRDRVAAIRAELMGDISERLIAKERLSTLQADLAHASRITAMGELAADIAHELNQPLTAAVNFLGTARFVLKRGGDSSQVIAMVEAATDQALRAGEIIRRLREFVAKREIGARYEPIAPAIREAAALVLVGQDQFGVRLVYDFDPKAEIMLADRIQVQQVLVNLIRNSVEALRVMPKENREIRLGTRALEDGKVEISVCDTGPGIPNAVLFRMYQPFTSTKGEEGMGIGLSISRRIVQAHGGSLEAENSPSGGACFRLKLPSVGEEELQT